MSAPLEKPVVTGDKWLMKWSRNRQLCDQCRVMHYTVVIECIDVYVAMLHPGCESYQSLIVCGPVKVE